MIVERGHALRLAHARLIVCDVDGTLTDGAMYYGPDGERLKRFHTRDGHGLAMLSEAGIEVALVTSEDSPIVTARATKLQIHRVVLGCQDKAAAVRSLREEIGVERAAVVAIGDDVGDLGAFAESGITVAVGDAEAVVKDAADLVCERGGGQGAVRELADAILAARSGLGRAPG